MKADVMVIGGGLHGLSAALQTARRGRKVLVLERHFVGRQASGATAAGVRTLGRDPAELPLSLEAAETWRNIAALVGDDCGFLACGQLQVAQDEAAVSTITRRVRGLEGQGMGHETLIGDNEVRSLVPDMAPGVLAAAWAPCDGAADPHRTIRAFRAAAIAAGVEIREGCEITALTRAGGVWRADTGHGPAEAPIVVNAAGAWAGHVARLAGDPVRCGVKNSMMIVTERTERRVSPVISSAGRALSFKQMAVGTLVIGGGVQGRLHESGERALVDFAALSRAAEMVRSLFPWTESLSMVRTWAGMEALTEDQLPVIGLSQRAEGLIHDFGFSGHGFQLVPSVGRVVADLATEGSTHMDLSAFAPSRLQETGVAA